MAKAVFCCGRMNPPTLGHLKVVRSMDDFAEQIDAETFVFSTAAHGERDPLAWEEKQNFLCRAFGHGAVLVKSPAGAIGNIADLGFDEAVFFIGQDRAAKFASFIPWAKTLGLTLSLHVLDRPIDDISATAAREAAADGDFGRFSRLVPDPDATFQMELYHAVRRGLGVEDAVGEFYR